MSQRFPPSNYVATESAVDGIEIYMPAPPDTEVHREIVEFTCPQCGAATAYGAADGGLTCTHCGWHLVVRNRMADLVTLPGALMHAAFGVVDECPRCGGRQFARERATLPEVVNPFGWARKLGYGMGRVLCGW